MFYLGIFGSFIFFIIAVIILWIRKRPLSYSWLFFSGLSTGPSLPGTKYLFPGVNTPTDPYPNETTVEILDNHSPRTLPKHIQYKDSFTKE